MNPLRAADLVPWFRDEALPLWRSVGVDWGGFGVFEALDHAGRPLLDMPKRLRVQARQVFVFATAARLWSAGDLPLARNLFAAVLERCFDEKTGGLASLLARDGAILAAPHDLYDVAFMLLADAAPRRAGAPVANDLETALARLKAPRGWRDRLFGPILPRSQNPHMHLFEAAVAQIEAGNDGFLVVAEECLDLFRSVFVRPDGSLLEFFDEDWRPVADGQRIEPGHVAEWIALIDGYERVTGRESGVELAPLYAFAAGARNEMGLLPDSLPAAGPGRRLWPQTEMFKAGRVAARRFGAPLDPGALPFAPWLATPAQGGWFDRLDEAGRVISTDMPASTAYHLVLACVAELDHQGRAVEAAPRPEPGRRPGS